MSIRHCHQIICSLPTKNILFIYLIYIRYYLHDELISIIFKISRTYWIRIKKELTEILYCKLHEFVTIGTFNERLKESMTFLQTTVTLIVDGFERQVMVPQDRKVEPHLFSSKKKQHSMNTIIGISPISKRFRFVSFPFGGSTNDYNLMKETMHHMTNDLQPQEFIIGDEGFHGLSNSRIITINNSKCDKNIRLSFNRIRVKVENAIRKIKEWSIASSRYRGKIATIAELQKARSDHHKFSIIVCAIENLKLDI